jgi:hypothetical protein
MYTVEIELGWEETITIKTDDFNKVAILQAFIAEQEECCWIEEDEAEEDIELMSFTDTEGVTWYYDEDEDEWLELEEDEEEDEDQE